MAQERCVKRNLNYGRVWGLGEVRTVSNYDEEGRPLASPHFRLVERDEVISEADFFDPEKVEEARVASGIRDKKAAITNALPQLDPDNDRHWTKAGLPNLATLHTMLDFEVSRGDVQAAWPEYDRDFARPSSGSASI